MKWLIFFMGYDLVYYKKADSSLEQDFFVRTADCLVPVEVKARSGCAQSMRTLIKSDHYKKKKKKKKLHGGNIGWANGVLTLPYSVVFLLKRYLSDANVGCRNSPAA